MVRIRFIFIMVALGAALLLLSPGCDELTTETIEVTIAGHPTAEFRISDTLLNGDPGGDSGCLGENSDFDEFKVYFEDASSGPVVKWMWNFGDGDIETFYFDSGDNGDIEHAYNETGTYTVTLAVFDSLDGADLETKKRAVIIGRGIDSMTVSEHIVCPGDSVTLTAHNPFGAPNWDWFFDTDSTLDDTSKVRKYAWDNPGNYEVRLEVDGDCGTARLRDTITVLHCAVPCFTVSTDEGCGSLSVLFTDCTETEIIDTATGETVGNVVSWLFNFGTGSPQFYDFPPDVEMVNYTAAGVYEASLTVTTDLGGETTLYDTIIVHPTDTTFTAAPTKGCQWVPGRQLVVAFTRVSSGDTAWLWDFGDGSTDTVQNPYHSYANPGTYDIELTAWGVCGDTSSSGTRIGIAGMITFSDPLQPVELLAFPDPTVVALVHFMDISSEAVVVDRFWDFGDALGNHPTGISVDYTYADTGHYWVKLSRYNLCDSLFDSVEVVIDSVVIVE